ncbi:C40 family peptidase [Bacillus sp. Marseille-P3661]|uniref:C40 family peptidase n=1 Tax=Bacillus sp. Marseille-P3661 TaxID=1936234 RepID=UPI00215542BB|nr:C40 family peptidase [Bacillus sp. Marseille-P3661]
MKKVLATFVILILTSVFSTTAMAAKEETNMVEEVIESAKTYIGVPYKTAGSSPSGFDCSGFVNYVFETENGINTERQAATLYKQGTSVEKAELKKGDLVFFNTSGSRISHVGIYTGNNEFIHASSSKGVMISSINDPYYWGSRYIGAKRILE